MKTKLVNKDIRENYTNELLMERGLSPEELDYFLNVPDDSALQSPLDLDYIKQAGALFENMIRLPENENIAVVVDSDVDGFTSAAIFIQYLRKFNQSVNIFPILHKGKGHGLSDTYEDVFNVCPSYVVIPDAGSNDFEYIEKFVEEFEDDGGRPQFLILDHHLVEPNTHFSDHAIIVNNQLSPKYKNKDLCGAGVTWQFCRYFDSIKGTSYANEFIDLAALGLISDMMSMLSLENRYIVHTGLHNIQNYFFKALCEKQSFSMGGKVNPISVAFYITPLINAMIRAGAEDEKQRCFQAFIDGHAMVESHKRGAKGTYEEVAIESARECTNARAKQNRILDKAVEELEIKIAKHDLLSNKVLFVRLEEDDQFPPELNGLVAMKLSAKYKKPTIVARLNEEGEIKGSSRGLNESELTSFKNFMDNSGYFTFTAGHDNACGIGILDKNLAAFHEYANKELANVDFGESWYEVNFERIAADTDIEDLIVDIANHEDLWGQQNNEPLIHIKDINITKNDIRIMGKDSSTVKIEKFGIAYMKFHAKDFIEELGKYDGEIKLEVVGRANINYWGGYATPQIFISNYQIEDGTLGF
jgi:single-stranded-DNA-specific exonuclease